MKRTWNPKKHKRMKKHGFLNRMANRVSQLILKRRRSKGRKKLTVVKKGK